MSNSDLFQLRPHHGLCISFFVGKGYDARFTAHMKNLIRILEEENPAIQLICKTDSICSHCPHNKNKLCDSECKVQRYDRAVLSNCNLHENQVLDWKKFHQIVEKQILNSRNLSEICTDCQWLGICKTIQQSSTGYCLTEYPRN